MKFVFWFLTFVAAIVLLLWIAYCWSNKSGHTGFDPYLGLWFFGPVFGIGIVGRMMTRGRWLSARCAEVLGFVGMAFVPFVTTMNILNEYEAWISAGMPERNPYAELLLVGFLVGVVGGSLAVALVITSKEQSGTK